ncbi:MAG: FHA domain-containing protein [Anaerolineae bacterium]|nr:FHA domain-containing protein [Anaerolineae bacterium]
MVDATRRCPVCDHENPLDEFVCRRCGARLEPPSFDTSLLPAEDGAEGEARASDGTATFGPYRTLRIEIEGSAQPVHAHPQPEIVLGRRDPGADIDPEIDLTPFAGFRMGVSRRHAAIRASGDRLNLWDLGSSNGTFLNGQRLAPDRPYTLHDGDEVRLGQMVLRISFE